MKTKKPNNKLSKKIKPAKKLPRPFKVTFSLNQKEYKMLIDYLEKNDISNRSMYIREVLMKHLWDRNDINQLVLFNDIKQL